MECILIGKHASLTREKVFHWNQEECKKRNIKANRGLNQVRCSKEQIKVRKKKLKV